MPETTLSRGGAAAAYLREEVLTASPTRLGVRVLAAAIAACEHARASAAAGNSVEWRKQISKAQSCVGELLGALDHEQGGEIAARLSALYQFVLSRLLLASGKPDAKRPEHAANLLSRIKAGFEQLLAKEERHEAGT